MPLTELAIRNAKPHEKIYSISDGDGLILSIKPNGSKTWVLRYWVAGKEKRAGLGKYPVIGLADARELKNAFKRELAHGGNPQERKRAEREEAAKFQALKAATFSKFAEEWYSSKEKAWSQSSRQTARRVLNNYLLPKFGNRPINEITAQEILKPLLVIEKDMPTIAHRAKMIASQVFQYAVMRGEAEFNVVFNLTNVVKGGNKRHFAGLTDPKDIAELMTRIEAYSGNEVVRAVLWFSLYTFQRPGEIRGAAWEEIDFDAALWRIPEHRMKKQKPHIVPLSHQVLEFLKKRTSLVNGSPYVFPSSKTRTPIMSSATILNALQSMGYTGEQMTAHGFRTTASTNLNEQGWNSDIIELSLAHVESNNVRASYNRAERLPERREMMQAWADWLDGLRKEA
jgi:integrase